MNNQKKTVLLIVLGVGVAAMTIAFAALSTTLRISGTASVPDVNWNIHFQNWQNNTNNKVTYGGNQHDNTAVYPDADNLTKTLSPNITKVEGLNVTLNQPGDYVSYKFQIINEGTIDASLSSFSHNLTCASGNDCSHLSYEVECTDSASGGNNVLVTNSTLAKNGGLAYCTLTVTYSDTTNQNSGNAGSNQTYTKAAASAELDATWVYIQKVDSNANSGSGSGSGSQEPEEPSTPVNPYLTTFDGTYGYDFPGAATLGNGGSTEWVSELDPDVKTYLRHSNSGLETCGVFESGQAGTVCLAPSASGYSSDFEDVSGEYHDITTSSGLVSTGLKGYSLAKADEMLSKGASSCYVGTGAALCYIPSLFQSNGSCVVDVSGRVDCGDDNSIWEIQPDGSNVSH